MSKTKKILIGFFGTLLVAILVVGGTAVGLLMRTLKAGHGEAGENHSTNLIADIGQGFKDMTQVAIQPKEGFPDQDKITILCMGIDDNWTDSDQVYTKASRTDTLFLLTLDLNSKKITMLSIPRDTYAHIAGTRDRYFKINEAYSTGGPQRSIATVAELLGVQADHYLVLNIDATKKMVDALGGVDVDVEHAMHYNDDWGHLHIDLQPGEQHLDGDQAVGFARYRHPDKGQKTTPEDGDERRMYRQHVLMRAMIAKGKSFANVSQAPRLMDTVMSTIRTDLTRTQLFDLFAIFHDVQTEGIQTASLPGDDFRGTDGAWFYRLDMAKAHAYVDWLVRGDETASRKLVSVRVKNGTSVPGLAEHAVAALKDAGFTDVHNGGNSSEPKITLTGTAAKAGSSRTTLLDTGVPDTTAPDQIAQALSLTQPVESRHPVKPNKLGWTPPAEVTVTLGQDYAAAVKSGDPGSA